jgi:ABC-type dipeptide/oligopeptide/nickel transport system permease component
VRIRDLLSYLGKRAVGSILVLVGVALIIFFISHMLNPDPAQLWAGPKARGSTLEAFRALYHLNQPLQIQLYYFFSGYLSGNFGVDPQTGRSIASEVAFYLPNTLELVITSLIIIVILGVGLGYLAGMRFSKRSDSAIRIFYLFTWSTPTFLGAVVAILVFASYFPIFPSGGMYSQSITPSPSITGIFVLDSLVQGNVAALASGIWHLILPATTLALLEFGLIARIMRSSVLDVRWSTHVKAARARGLSEGEVRSKHILRNALIDTNTMVAMMFGWLLSGTVVIEQVFAWPGIGQFGYQAITSVNYPVLVAVVLVFTIGVIVANFIADVAYSLLDPRITLGESA